jgi:hypothetical protein
MTQLRQAHLSHHVADAHGRTVDLTVGRPPHMHTHADTRRRQDSRPRGRPIGTVVVRVAALLAGGLVVSIFLLVLRDIITTLASTSATGVLVRALLAPGSRRDR